MCTTPTLPDLDAENYSKLKPNETLHILKKKGEKREIKIYVDRNLQVQPNWWVPLRRLKQA